MIWLLVLIAGPDPAEVEAAVRRVLEAGEYQTELPDASAPPSPEPPTTQAPDAPRHEIDSREVDEPISFESEGWATVGTAIIWILGGVLLAMVAVWMFNASRVTRYRDAPVPTSPAPVATPPPTPVSPPEEFARAGRFGDAIHATLLQLLADLPRVADSPSWTSREIVRQVSLGADAKDALGKLVVLVERCLFAGDPVSEADFQHACACETACRKGLA